MRVRYRELALADLEQIFQYLFTWIQQILLRS